MKLNFTCCHEIYRFEFVNYYKEEELMQQNINMFHDKDKENIDKTGQCQYNPFLRIKNL